MDCNEYFDYIVPTSVMVKFFDENPVGITSHKFCDLRLYRVLADLFPYEAQDHPSYPWLLIHYKVSEDAKKHTFDNHGRRKKESIILSTKHHLVVNSSQAIEMSI